MDYKVLKEYYVQYLKNVRLASDSTVNHYLGALKTISGYLVEKDMLTESIYELNEVSELLLIRDFLFSQDDFVEKDERGNRMYSAGLNNYVRFAEGSEFEKATPSSIIQMDIEIPVGIKTELKDEQWKRSGIIKKQSIEMAKYVCEINGAHETFISAATGHQYMEGHHAIPINKQGMFDKSLDVYANIVCLCPICHRLMHYGRTEDKVNSLNQIYYKRADRLAKSGIKLSHEEFFNVVNS